MEWPSWPAPPDLPSSSQYAIDAPSGTVTDTVTGLTWVASVPDRRFTWQEARNYCSCLSLGGQSDWRLPSQIELVSIIDFGASDPAIDTTAFPDTPKDWTWTASPYTAVAGVQPWAVSFGTGMTTSYGEGVPIETLVRNWTRCVRGPLGNASAPAYVVASDTVYDPVTDLTWQRAVGAERFVYADAASRCAGLMLGAATWRLPTVKELESLFGGAAGGAFATSSVFQVVAGHIPAFWSSTGDVAAPGLNRWAVSEYGDAMQASEQPTADMFDKSVICLHSGPPTQTGRRAR